MKATKGKDTRQRSRVTPCLLVAEHELIERAAAQLRHATRENHTVSSVLRDGGLEYARKILASKTWPREEKPVPDAKRPRGRPAVEGERRDVRTTPSLSKDEAEVIAKAVEHLRGLTGEVQTASSLVRTGGVEYAKRVLKIKGTISW